MVDFTEEQLDLAFAALADPTRRAIIDRLARVIARGTWLLRDQATAEGASTSQLPLSSGASISSQPSWVEPFGPEWPSWIATLASVSAWMKPTMRFQALSCSGA